MAGRETLIEATLGVLDVDSLIVAQTVLVLELELVLVLLLALVLVLVLLLLSALVLLQPLDVGSSGTRRGEHLSSRESSSRREGRPVASPSCPAAISLRLVMFSALVRDWSVREPVTPLG